MSAGLILKPKPYGITDHIGVSTLGLFPLHWTEWILGQHVDSIQAHGVSSLHWWLESALFLLKHTQFRHVIPSFHRLSEPGTAVTSFQKRNLRLREQDLNTQWMFGGHVFGLRGIAFTIVRRGSQPDLRSSFLESLQQRWGEEAVGGVLNSVGG